MERRGLVEVERLKERGRTMKKNDVYYLRVRDDARSIVNDFCDKFDACLGIDKEFVDSLTDEDILSGFLVLSNDGDGPHVDWVSYLVISHNGPPAQYHEVGKEKFFDLCSCFPRKTRCISLGELFDGLPSWSYVAKDGDGTVYLYKNKPEYNEISHEWFPVDGAEEYLRLSEADIPGNSKYSLRKLDW